MPHTCKLDGILDAATEVLSELRGMYYDAEVVCILALATALHTGRLKDDDDDDATLTGAEALAVLKEIHKFTTPNVKGGKRNENPRKSESNQKTPKPKNQGKRL